ncbi:MAG: D-aminoacyl-tRNA deacylase [Actinomycetota bacterium]|nr:D-aminoacyl-tRNA deacylase [Actinomycetota bacterium]
MRALVQRVNWARVEVVGAEDGGMTAAAAEVGTIGLGLCVLVGVTHSDDEAVAERLAAKVWHLRVFAGSDGVMQHSLAETSRAALVVSQFTLYGDTRRGRRPSWAAAAPPEVAEPLVGHFCAALEQLGAAVAKGRFGAHMRLALSNDGPVTLLLEL